MMQTWSKCHRDGAYLLPPVLETLLTLRVTVLLVQEVERDKRAGHTSNDAHADDSVYPLANLVWSVGGLTALPVVTAVEGRALLVCIATRSNGLSLDALQLL